MTLEEAIKHAEEVAKENEDSAKEYYRIASLEYHPNKKDAENSYTKCMECHKEHRQLAEWLKELKKYREENDWISCSETVDIPEYKVLCCDRYGEELIGWISCSDEQWLCESEETLMYDPIAWMPLPQTYKK